MGPSVSVASAAPSPRVGPAPMTGKVVLVTGGTKGVGEATARALARLGARVLLTGRDARAAESVADRIRSSGGSAEGIGADLSTRDGARRLAATVSDRAPRLDVLVNNAGGIFARRTTTADGLERTWALNVVAPFLLMRELAGALAAAAPSRIVNVASSAHRRGHLDLGDPGRARSYSAWGAYAQSKLALLLLTREAARRFAPRRIDVNAVHPGFVASEFGRENGGAFGRAIAVAETLFAIRPDRGARTSVRVAAAPELVGTTGTYFVRGRPREPSRAARDDPLAARLWSYLEAETAGAPSAVPTPPSSKR